MIITEDYRVSRYFEQIGRVPTSTDCGPVLRLKARFARWQADVEVDADAFVDPGADVSFLSERWLRSHAPAPPAQRLPSLRHKSYPDGQRDRILVEPLMLSVSGRTFTVPLTSEGPRIRLQDLGDGRPNAENTTEKWADMGGYEDILLGRDFLDANDLLLVIDGAGRRFSLVVPDDEDNQRRRAAIRGALSIDGVAKPR